MHEVRTLYFPVIIGQSGRSATGSVAREILDSASGGRDFLDSSSPTYGIAQSPPAIRVLHEWLS